MYLNLVQSHRIAFHLNFCVGLIVGLNSNLWGWLCSRMPKRGKSHPEENHLLPVALLACSCTPQRVTVRVSKSYVLFHRFLANVAISGLEPILLPGFALARRLGAEACTLIAEGRDPIEERRLAEVEKQTAVGDTTFREAALGVYEELKSGFRNAKCCTVDHHAGKLCHPDCWSSPRCRPAGVRFCGGPASYLAEQAVLGGSPVIKAHVGTNAADNLKA